MLHFNNKPAKKLVIKGFKAKSRLPDGFEAETLRQIEATIGAVFADEALPYGHEAIYRMCETLCSFQAGPQLYQAIYRLCEAETVKEADRVFQLLSSRSEPGATVHVLAESWSKYLQHVCLLEGLFLHLDRVYIALLPEPLLSIRRFCLNFFHGYIFTQPDRMLSARSFPRLVLDETLGLFAAVRGGGFEAARPEMSLAGCMVEMLRAIGEYEGSRLGSFVGFEREFLQKTAEYYGQASEASPGLLSNVAGYLKFAEDCLVFEETVVGRCIAPSTRPELVATVEKGLLSDRMHVIFTVPAGSCLKALFAAGDADGFRRLFKLIDRVFALDALAQEWAFFIRAEGQAVMWQGSGLEADAIKRVVCFKERLDAIVSGAFCGSEALKAAMKDAFEGFLNYRQDRTAELLALHIHQCLLKPLEPERLESFTGSMLLLFRHLHSKDVFEASYKRFLAERLLRGLSSDLALERALISGMRQECGGVYTSRMEAIVKDVEQSAELTEHFKAAMEEAAAEKDKKMPTSLLGVTSITVVSGLWPLQGAAVSASDVQAPSQVGKIETAFSDFYMQKRRNCSLRWNELLGSVVLRARFRDGKSTKELAVSVPQAMVLLQFIDRKITERTVDELSKLISMSRDILESTLGSLTSQKWPILLCDPQSPHIYRINEDFDCEERRLPLFSLQSPFLSTDETLVAAGGSGTTPVMSVASLSSAASLEMASANGTVPVSVISERQGQVDSLLVRRIKSVGRAERTELTNYALAMLKTLPISAADVAGRIDHLVSHGYFEVGGPAKQVLTYIP